MKGCVEVSNEFIVPTGRIIKEYLDEYNISQKELSVRIGMSEKHISNVLNGNSHVTEEFALKLEKVLSSVSASYWLNYEAKYRENLARQKELVKLDQQNLKEIAQKFHFKEVFKGLDLSLIDQAVEMLKLLKISDFSYFNETYGKLKVDFMEDRGEKEAIVVWLNLCESEIEIQNKEIDNISYSEINLKKSLVKFKLLSSNDNVELSINSCRKLCNQLGIYLILCEAITNSKVRGAVTTYKDHPAIYLSARFKSHDHLWFAFIHEIAHLLLHYNRKDVIITFEDRDTNDKEAEANEFARDFFINSDDYIKFVKNNVFTDQSIRRFACQQEVLPGIVVARLQHEGLIDYNQLSYLKIYLNE